jgi:hypothetical protein
MLWNIAPVLIVIGSILISLYVFQKSRNKRYFWSSLTLSGINLLGGWLFAMAVNFIMGLILLVIPFTIMIKGYYNYRKAR